MRKQILLIAFFLAAFFSVPVGAWAEELDPNTDYLIGFNDVCHEEIIPTESDHKIRFISGIVHCFENVITELAIDTITSMSEKLRDVVNAAMVLYVIIFGVKIATGMVNSPRGEVIVLAVKIAFVSWLINDMGIMDMWYMTLGAYQSVLEVMITPASMTVCPMTAMLSLDVIWDTMDCLFAKIIGFEAPNGFGSSYQGLALLFSTLVAKTQQGGGAYLPAAFIANSILTLVFSFLKIAMAYIISMLGLLMLFAIAPLTLPMMFFRQTQGFFEAWYKMIISLMMQAVILFAFVSFAFGIIAQIYDGPGGLKEMFGATQITNEVTGANVSGTNTDYMQGFTAKFTDVLQGNGDMNMIVNFVSLMALGYLMLSFISLVGQIAQELSGANNFPNLMEEDGSGGMNFGVPKL